MPSDRDEAGPERPLLETYRGLVYPGDCDPMGHLPTFRYLQMFEVASYHFFGHLGWDFTAGGDVGFADLRHEIDYRAEIRAGSLLLVRSGLLSVGRSSLRSIHVMTDAAKSKEHARLEMVTVCFDLAARRSRPLPEDLRQRAEAFL